MSGPSVDLFRPSESDITELIVVTDVYLQYNHWYDSH